MADMVMLQHGAEWGEIELGMIIGDISVIEGIRGRYERNGENWGGGAMSMMTTK